MRVNAAHAGPPLCDSSCWPAALTDAHDNNFLHRALVTVIANRAATRLTMAPKRPLQSNNDSTPPSQRPAIGLTDNQSPPPTQRSSLEHHHSPMAGHHPDMPADAAVAIASPQGRKSNENAMPITNQPCENAAIIVPNGQQPPATAEHPPAHPTSAAAAETESQSSLPVSPAAGNNGARNAYLASQQNRAVTCNLSLLPPSIQSLLLYTIYSPHHICRYQPKNTDFRHRDSDVYSTGRTTCSNVHVGG